MYDALSDSEVIQRVLAGEKDAYRALVHRYGREIRIRANRVTPKVFSSEDVAQETFVRAYFRLNTFRLNGNFQAWLYGILRHIVGDLYREAERAKNLPFDELADYVEELAAQAPVPEGGTDLSEALRHCVKGLPDNSRRLVRMRYEEGKSGLEIGALLEKTQFAVNTALMRVRRQLRKCIELRLGYEV
ncbi:MAG: sigma-70 family RNA polymerase sigma factor [Kiritimatiellae bacterium]|nr:sigma-70 family RNA polymerase sigma factor [Kiritimatiellia bacterium]